MGSHEEEGIHGGRRGVRSLNAFATGFLPTARVAVLVACIAMVVGATAAVFVAMLRRRGVKVAYSRKVYHFTIFTTAAVVHTVWALPGTVVFGVVIAAMVLAAVVAGEGQPFYEALARDKDRPHRTLFIVVPLATTAIGGLVSALLTGPYASVGYLAAGWGDAAGEPAGARWGRHPYRVPSLAGVPATRTVEGSAAVFAVASAGSMLAIWTLDGGAATWWMGLVCGFAAALVEAVSNHGLDNFTVQVVPSLVALWLLA